MRIRPAVVSVVVALAAAVIPAFAEEPVGTAFTYQGRFSDGPAPASGRWDLLFKLYDAAMEGAQVGSDLVLEDVEVVDGVFTVKVDFGSGIFEGSAHWLETGVRPGDSTGDFAILSPRPELTPAPNAIFAQTVPWSGVSDKPAGFEDGRDDDSLASLPCAGGQVPRWDGASWVCADAGAGDITGVSAGPGLTGGGARGDVTLAVGFVGSGAANSAARSDHNHFGAVWRGEAPEAGFRVVNQGSGISAITGEAGSAVRIGVEGYTASPTGYGVSGVAGAASGKAVGVSGSSSSTLGTGVLAIASAASGFTSGVRAQSASTAGTGVSGLATANTGSTSGVRGESRSTAGTGVVGVASATTGRTAGVRGETQSASGKGVLGMAPAATGIGVSGIAGGIGVQGEASSPAGNWGVYGLAGASTGNSFGVHGVSTSATGVGVYGVALVSPSATGVVGQANSGTGVLGFAIEGGAGVRGEARGVTGTAGHFVNSAGGTGLYVGGGPRGRVINTSPGAYLSAGGVWTNRSDAGDKENFEAVDSGQLLERVSRLPISSWNYKAEDREARHIGPTAQDFRAAFGLGDGHSISTVDPSGIALAAIQALHRTTQELASKAAELDVLRARIEEIETALLSLRAAGSAEHAVGATADRPELE